jgi:hypothetical protein
MFKTKRLQLQLKKKYTKKKTKLLKFHIFIFQSKQEVNEQSDIELVEVNINNNLNNTLIQQQQQQQNLILQPLILQPVTQQFPHYVNLPPSTPTININPAFPTEPTINHPQDADLKIQSNVVTPVHTVDGASQIDPNQMKPFINPNGFNADDSIGEAVVGNHPAYARQDSISTLTLVTPLQGSQLPNLNTLDDLNRDLKNVFENKTSESSDIAMQNLSSLPSATVYQPALNTQTSVLQNSTAQMQQQPVVTNVLPSEPVCMSRRNSKENCFNGLVNGFSGKSNQIIDDLDLQLKKIVDNDQSQYDSVDSLSFKSLQFYKNEDSTPVNFNFF